MALLNFVPLCLGCPNCTYSLNLPLILGVLLGLIYVKVDKVAGSITLVGLVLLALLARCSYLSANKEGTLSRFIMTNIALQVVGWVAQVVSHEVIEKRRPAVSDNPLLTLVAPFFVVVEVMFYLGWRSNLNARCQKKIDANVEEFHRTRKTTVN